MIVSDWTGAATDPAGSAVLTAGKHPETIAAAVPVVPTAETDLAQPGVADDPFVRDIQLPMKAVGALRNASGHGQDLQHAMKGTEDTGTVGMKHH